VNGKPLTIQDRDYLSRLQCLWTYGSDEYSDECKALKKNQSRPKQGKEAQHHRLGSALLKRSAIFAMMMTA